MNIVLSPGSGAIFVAGSDSISSFIKKQYTLGKKERVKSRKLIDHLFKKGRSFSVFPFRVYYSFGGNLDVPIQAGFGVPIRNIKKAVDRNRVKRLMKEAYRLQRTELQSLLQQKNLQLALFFIFTGKELPDFNLASDKVTLILKRLVKISNENDSPMA